MTNSNVTIKIRQSSYEKLQQLASHEDRSQIAVVSRLVDEAYAAARLAAPDASRSDALTALRGDVRP